MSDVCVLAVHPDDETLGAGGTLLKHVALGDSVCWCIVTTSRGTPLADAAFERRRDEQIESVAEAFGFDRVEQLGLPTTRLDTLDFGDVVATIGGVLAAVSPRILYLPFHHDVHSDHRVVAEAGLVGVKSFRYPSIRRIAMMEVVSESEYGSFDRNRAFCPNQFVDIAAYLRRKQEILSIYDSELAPHPFPRSARNVEALATLRGSMCGSEYAEAFQVVRDIW